MSNDALEDEATAGTVAIKPELDKALVTKAVNALIKHHEKQVEASEKTQLLGTDAVVNVQFTLEVTPLRHNPRPLRLKIPHEIYNVTSASDGDNLEKPEVCLIVKDDAKPWLQDMIEAFPEDMGHIKKVLTLTSLRDKHSEYKARNELRKRFSCFLADDRIVKMLMKLMGKKFWDAKKQPIPIRITQKKNIPRIIRQALQSSYVTLRMGNCLLVKAGFTGMPVTKIVENCIAVADETAKWIPRGWANIRAMGIKTPSSTMLPIYNKTPAELEEIARLAGIPRVYVEDNPPTDDDDEEGGKDSEIARNKRKRDLEKSKNPLSKALKKQKEMEKDEAKKDDVNDGKESDEKDSGSKKDHPMDESPSPQKKDKKRVRDNEKPKHNQKETEEETDEQLGENPAKEESPPKKAKVDDGKRSPKDDTAGSSSSKTKETVDTPTSKTQEPAASSSVSKADDSAEKKKAKKKKKERKESKATADKDDAKGKLDTPTNKKQKLEAESKSDESAEKKSEKKKTKKDAKTTPDKEEEEEGKEFLERKKFDGPKKGYVFKKGPEGLGYYLDIKPTVDKSALDALVRAAEQKNGKGGGSEKGRRSKSPGRRSKSPGKRRGRR